MKVQFGDQPRFDPRNLAPDVRISDTKAWSLLINPAERADAANDAGPLMGTTILVFPPMAAGSGEIEFKSSSASILARFHPKPDWLPWLRHFPVSSDPTCFEVLEPWALEIVRQCLQSLTEASAPRTQYSDALTQNAVERLLLLVIQCHENMQPSIDRRIAKVVRLLSANAGADITIDAAAATVGLSPSRLSHLFRDQMGITFSNYGQLAKVERARCLLENSDATSETVARELGMNPSYFSSWFRKRCGVSPSAYRLE